MEGVVLDSLAKVAGCPVALPHLECSRPGFGGDRHEADQHGNA